MKIALILAVPPGYSETFFSNKIQILREEGYQVELYTDGDGKDSRYRYIKGFSISGFTRLRDLSRLTLAFFRLIQHPVKSIRLYRFNKQDGYSFRRNIRSLLLCSHIIGSRADWLYYGFATIALERENLAKALGCKMAVSIRGYDISIYPLKNPGCYDLLWKRIDKLHYISDDILQLAKKHGFSDNIPHVKVSPAIDTNTFEFQRQFAQPWNQELSFLTIARLSWKKGLNYTLRALSILKENNIPFKYTIIGNGDERERLLYAAHELGLSENLNIVGPLSQQEIIPFLKGTDIYIQYSVQEGFCNAVLEAQSMGCICVASDAGGLPENVLHHQTGYVVPKRDPEKLAAQLISILSEDQERLDTIRQQALRRVSEEFNLDKQKKEFIRFYSE